MKNDNIIAKYFIYLAVVLPLFWVGFRYKESLQRLNTEWLLVLALGLTIWSVGKRLYTITLILLIGGGYLTYQLFFLAPHWHQQLRLFSETASPVWLKGSIIHSSKTQQTMRVLLGNSQVEIAGNRQTFTELVVRFPHKRTSVSAFYKGRQIIIHGFLKGIHQPAPFLELTLTFPTYHTTIPAPTSWEYSLQFLKQHLLHRAAFYLSSNAYALYAPVTLAKAQYQSHPSQIFRETGMAHLLTISGLHIGLLFWLGLMLMKQSGRFSVRLQLWLYFPQFYQGLTIVFLWGYIVLIGFPIPAVRAIVMLSIMTFVRWTGQASSSIQILFVTAFIFIGLDPTVIYSISFQLSFLAVFFIFLSLPFFFKNEISDTLWRKLTKNIVNSMIVTGSVLLGIWPIITTHFHAISFEIFWLNLIMLPLLAFIVLPLCFIGFFISLLYAYQLPFAWIEQFIFQLIEHVLTSWLSILEFLHTWGKWSILSFQLSWLGWHYLMYYGVTIGLLYQSAHFFKKRIDS